MGEYDLIQEWIKLEFGFTVKTCWIAHAKELCNLPVGKAHNRYDENVRRNPCPGDKLVYIKKAFKHFGMIE